MARTYYTLIGKATPRTSSPYEVIFGDYDREIVLDEKYDTTGYYGMKIMASGDTQAELDTELAKYNAPANRNK